jgi:hypothetical protein
MPAADTYRRQLAAHFGPAYATVIARAGELHHQLALATVEGCDTTAVLFDTALICERHRRLVMLDTFRTAAADILSEPPNNHPAADPLAGVHIWRMSRAIGRDHGIAPNPQLTPHSGGKQATASPTPVPRPNGHDNDPTPTPHPD